MPQKCSCYDMNISSFLATNQPLVCPECKREFGPSDMGILYFSPSRFIFTPQVWFRLGKFNIGYKNHDSGRDLYKITSFLDKKEAIILLPKSYFLYLPDLLSHSSFLKSIGFLE